MYVIHVQRFAGNTMSQGLGTPVDDTMGPPTVEEPELAIVLGPVLGFDDLGMLLAYVCSLCWHAHHLGMLVTLACPSSWHARHAGLPVILACHHRGRHTCHPGMSITLAFPSPRHDSHPGMTVTLACLSS